MVMFFLPKLLGLFAWNCLNIPDSTARVSLWGAEIRGLEVLKTNHLQHPLKTSAVAWLDSVLPAAS